MNNIGDNHTLSYLYKFIKSGERRSNINNLFEKAVTLSEKRKDISYPNLVINSSLVRGLDRSYQITTNSQNEENLEISLEDNFKYTDSIRSDNLVLFNINRVTVRSTAPKSELAITESLTLRNIDADSEIVNINTLVKSDRKLHLTDVSFSSENPKIQLNLNRNLEIGKTKNHFVKVRNDSGHNYVIGRLDSNTANIKVEFTTVSYQAGNLSTSNLIDYDIYTGDNALRDNNNKIRNLWLVNGANAPVNNTDSWIFENSWLETNKNNIHYLMRPAPTVSHINITGSISPANIKSSSYYDDVDPTTLHAAEANGHVLLATAASQSSFGYTFRSGDSYLLDHVNSTSKINYINNKYTVSYPSGYTENLSTGAVASTDGGFLGFAPKGAKIIFIEDPTLTKIKIVPTQISDGTITEYTVYSNEFIFD